jgi:hypothetical protein
MLRAIIGFDHIGKNLAEASWLPNCGYNITRIIGPKQLSISTDGWLVPAAGVSTGSATQTILDFSAFMVPGNTGLSIGIRFKTVTPGSSGAMLMIGTVVAGTDAQLIANFNSLPAAAQLTNGEAYLEIVYDFVANTYSAYWDDVYGGAGTIATVSVANLKAGKLVLFINQASANSSGVLGIKDIVLTDNIAGDGIITRLGPRQCVPITVDVASGTDWTVSDGGTILNALNAALETGVATCTSGPSKAPLVVSLKATIPAGANIDGIMLSMIGKTDVAGALTGVKLTNGAASINGQSKAIGTTQKYGNPMGAFARAPDGSRWTASSIDSTTLSLTPDVAS